MTRWQPNNEYLDKAIRDFPPSKRVANRLSTLQNILSKERARAPVGIAKVDDEIVEDRTANMPVSRNVFVVHGHAEGDRLKLTRLLEKNLGLVPIVVQEEANESFETIFQKIERLAATCDTAIVLVTPDAECKDGGGQGRMYSRTWLFLGPMESLTSTTNPVLRKGDVNMLSDIAGLSISDMTGTEGMLC